jgi:hypothetical protein
MTPSDEFVRARWAKKKAVGRNRGKQRVPVRHQDSSSPVPQVMEQARTSEGVEQFVRDGTHFLAPSGGDRQYC